MASPHYPPPAAKRAVRNLGADIREARLRRRLTMEIVAGRAATSRPTIARIERGDTSVSMGIVASVLQSLGLVDNLGQVANSFHDDVGQRISRDDLPKRARPRRLA